MSPGVVVGLFLVAVFAVTGAGVAVVVIRRRRREARETPLERYRRNAAGLHYTPQTWRTDRAAAVRRQNKKRWAAGSAGSAGAGGFVAGGYVGPGDGGSGCSAGGCGGGGCGGGGGGCGGGGS